MVAASAGLASARRRATAAVAFWLLLGGAACAQSLVDERRPELEPAESAGNGGLDIVEGYLDGAQTGTGFGEDYLLGVPRDLGAGGARPLLLAWHGYGAPPRQIFRDTDYPAACAARGWFLLAPRGLDDKSFGYPPAQRNVLAVLARVLDEHPIDRERLYAVGWSMGAQSALCFAARHRDHESARFAAVAALQGPHDVLDTYARESPALRAWLELLFGAAPEVDPRPYVRASCVRLDAARRGVLSEPSYAWQIADLPLLLVFALDDPLSYLRAQNEELGAYLRGRGSPVSEWSVSGRAPAHDWRVVSAEAVCAWLSAHVARGTPPCFELVSDGEAARGGVRLHPEEREALSSARVARDEGGWSLARLRGGREVEIDASALEPRETPLVEIALRGSGGALGLRVRGLPKAPAAVFRGARAFTDYTWSAEEGLRIPLRSARSRWRIAIEPGAQR